MLELTSRDVRHFRLLICLPLLLGFWYLLSPSPVQSALKVWPEGSIDIEIEEQAVLSGELLEVISDRQSIVPEFVVINEANREQLLVCPGIGSKTATLLLKERNLAKFVDWRDLQDRVRGLSLNKIRLLQEAGVRLDRQENKR